LNDGEGVRQANAAGKEALGVALDFESIKNK
jgi:hypothetical protein